MFKDFNAVMFDFMLIVACSSSSTLTRPRWWSELCYTALCWGAEINAFRKKVKDCRPGVPKLVPSSRFSFQTSRRATDHISLISWLMSSSNQLLLICLPLLWIKAGHPSCRLLKGTFLKGPALFLYLISPPEVHLWHVHVFCAQIGHNSFYKAIIQALLICKNWTGCFWDCAFKTDVCNWPLSPLATLNCASFKKVVQTETFFNFSLNGL